MDSEEALNIIDELVKAKTGKNLDELEKAIFLGAWEKQSYPDIAQNAYVDEGHLKNLGSSLWTLLSKILETKVNKTTFRGVIEKKYFKSEQQTTFQKSPEGEGLAQQMRNWFETLGYQFESYQESTDNYFEWIIIIPARRGYDRILVRGVTGEAKINDVREVKKLVKKHNTDEGWIVAARRVSPGARQEAKEPIYCYTFDQLIDDVADFSNYIDWLEEEIKSKGVDPGYVPLACRKEEIALFCHFRFSRLSRIC